MVLIPLPCKQGVSADDGYVFSSHHSTLKRGQGENGASAELSLASTVGRAKRYRIPMLAILPTWFYTQCRKFNLLEE